MGEGWRQRPQGAEGASGRRAWWHVRSTAGTPIGSSHQSRSDRKSNSGSHDDSGRDRKGTNGGCCNGASSIAKGTLGDPQSRWDEERSRDRGYCTAKAQTQLKAQCSSSRIHSGQTLQAAFLSLLLLVVLFAQGSKGGPITPDDSFKPACGGKLPRPSPGQWRLWSQTSTWGGKGVPGVGLRRGANVTIQCGQAVMVDVPNIDVTLLRVLGALMFRDDKSLPQITLTASFVIVEGRFIIGSKQRQFSQRARIVLKPNPNNRQPYMYTSRLPADTTYPRNLGHKAFAVVGGQVDFHGLPGPASMPTWTRLAATGRKGQKAITVQGDVSRWPVGAPIVIAPTGYWNFEEDVVTIKSKQNLGKGKYRINFDQALKYDHSGDPRGISDGFGGFIDQTAEVALLRRNIVITGTDEPAPYSLEGGHFIVFFTQTPQGIEGVEFLLMGQQGQLGRYSIHLHLCGDQRGRSVVRKNLIIHSKQRCVVVHATFNAGIEGNVAYNTSGHCFLVEEGGETGNTFLNNLGIRTRKVEVKIPPMGDPEATKETDDLPSTFWITNPNNNFIGNAAVGSDDSGFWMELRGNVRGFSASWKKTKRVRPITVPQVGTFSRNTAHSNMFAGFRIYPHGYFPRINNEPSWVEFGGFNLWKNQKMGAMLKDMDHVVFSDSTFADNFQGVALAQVQGMRLRRHRFVGDSRQMQTQPQRGGVGNPKLCEWVTPTCGPSQGCTTYYSPGIKNPFQQGPGFQQQFLFGVVFQQDRFTADGASLNLVEQSTFAAYNPRCKIAAAFALGASRWDYWKTGNLVRRVRFHAPSLTNRVYVYPKITTGQNGWVTNGGAISPMAAMRDMDGSLFGKRFPKGGFVVARNSPFLPPRNSRLRCGPVPNSNAMACPGSCFRTLYFEYFEPQFSPYPAAPSYEQKNLTDGPRKLGDYSFWKVKRLRDGKQYSLEGNLKTYHFLKYPPHLRIFSITLPSDTIYELTFVPGVSARDFVPQNVTFQYRDGNACGRGLTLRFPGLAGKYSWRVHESNRTTWRPCPGNAFLTPYVGPVRFSYECHGVTRGARPALALQLQLDTAFRAAEEVVITSLAAAPQACQGFTRCGLTATGTLWQYNQRRIDLHSRRPGGPAFYNPLYPTAAPAWRIGRGVFGYVGYHSSRITTFLEAPFNPRTRTTLRTYYFKTRFGVANSRCYSTLLIDVVLNDGVVLYLNNVELLRSNMPKGPINSKTPALTPLKMDPAIGYQYERFTYTFKGSKGPKLVEGVNYIAAEVHMAKNSYDVAFDLRVSALRSTFCKGSLKSREVCDGLDNNGDGLVDRDPRTKKPLTRPCKGKGCKGGVQRCVRGAYV